MTTTVADIIPIPDFIWKEPNIQLLANKAEEQFKLDSSARFLINLMCVYKEEPLNEHDSGARLRQFFVSTPNAYHEITHEQYKEAIEKAFSLYTEIEGTGPEKVTQDFVRKEATVLSQLLMAYGVHFFKAKEGAVTLPITKEASLIMNHLMKVGQSPVLHAVIRNISDTQEDDRWEFYGVRWDERFKQS